MELLESRELLSAGDLDLGFSGGKVITDLSGRNDAAYAIAIQADNKVLVGGGADIYSSLKQDYALARYNPDGSLDPLFGENGIAKGDFGTDDRAYTIRDIAVQPDGKIVAAVDLHWAFDLAVARFNADGTPDTSFGGDGLVTINFGYFGNLETAWSVAIQADGKILVAGDKQLTGFALARLNADDGSLDESFGNGGMVTTTFDVWGYAQGIARKVFALSDGGVLAVGDLPLDGELALARYDSQGKLDGSFGADGIVRMDVGAQTDRWNLWVSSALQADGKVVVGATSKFPDDFLLTRFNTDGSLDSSFDGDGIVVTDIAGSLDNLFGIAIQANGKIVAAGTRQAWEQFALARYNPDGSLDTSFGVDGKVKIDFGSGIQNVAHAVAIQPYDGKIVAAGMTFRQDTNDDFAIVRLEGDAVAAVAAVPTGLTATATGAQAIVISWNSVSEASAYKLERYDWDSGSWKQIYYGSALQYTDAGSHLQPNTTYYYEVRASNAAGDSGYSSWAWATTSAGVDLKGEWCLATDQSWWGQTINVERAQIFNAGPAAADTFAVQWYLSQDSTGSADDILLYQSSGFSAYYHAGIAGDTYGPEFSASLKLPTIKPSTWSGDSFFIVMKTDAYNWVTESDESNNFGQVGETWDYDPIAITAPPTPDLKGEWCLATDQAKWGQTITVEKAEVFNAGAGAAGAFAVRWYLSSDSLGSPDDVLLYRTSGSSDYFHGSLAGNSVGPALAVTLKLPSAKPAGWTDTHFYIVMKTDAYNQVPESDENNNFGQVGATWDYDPIRITQPPARSITETIQGSAPASYPQLLSQIKVKLQRVDQGSGPINPNLRTWLIVHGRKSNPNKVNMYRLRQAVQKARPKEQVLVLNWSQGAWDNAGKYGLQGSRWIAPVASWTAGILDDLGLQASNLLLIGHSWGAHVCGEIAHNLDLLQETKVKGLVALDPAVLDPGPANYYTGAAPDFARHAEMSWAFNSSAFGSNAFAKTASQSFNVWVGNPANPDAHKNVVDLFASMVLKKGTPAKPLTQWFNLMNLLDGNWGPWGDRAGFEATVTAVFKNGHWQVKAVVY